MSADYYECRRCGQRLYAWSSILGCHRDPLQQHEFNAMEIKIAPPPPEDLNLQELEMNGQETKDGGIKHDENKPRWELIPYDAIRGVAEVLTSGAQKYSARNWELGIAYGRVFGAVQRHLTAWWQGEDNDPESGRSHLDHALCELIFLSAYEKRGMKQLDDRPQTPLAKKAAEMNAEMFENFKLGANDPVDSNATFTNIRPIKG